MLRVALLIRVNEDGIIESRRRTCFHSSGVKTEHHGLCFQRRLRTDSNPHTDMILLNVVEVGQALM